MQNTEISFIGKISSNGRIVIPYEIREALELHDGDIIELKLLRILKRASGRVFPRRGDEGPKMTGQETEGSKI
jgi:AbrB family looped-hinge helix DNA binding protein